MGSPDFPKLHDWSLNITNSVEATKNICHAKNESTVTRWLKKFHLGCKNLNDQANSGKTKNMDSKSMLQAIEADLVSSTREYQAYLGSHSSVWFVTIMTLAKASGVEELCLTLPNYCKTFDSLSYLYLE